MIRKSWLNPVLNVYNFPNFESLGTYIDFSFTHSSSVNVEFSFKPNAIFNSIRCEIHVIQYFVLSIFMLHALHIQIPMLLFSGMPLDFYENNWKSMCACRLTENEHKKRQKVQKEKDEIGENREQIRPKITEKNGK